LSFKDDAVDAAVMAVPCQGALRRYVGQPGRGELLGLLVIETVTAGRGGRCRHGSEERDRDGGSGNGYQRHEPLIPNFHVDVCTDARVRPRRVWRVYGGRAGLIWTHVEWVLTPLLPAVIDYTRTPKRHLPMPHPPLQAWNPHPFLPSPSIRLGWLAGASPADAAQGVCWFRRGVCCFSSSLCRP